MEAQAIWSWCLWLWEKGPSGLGPRTLRREELLWEEALLAGAPRTWGPRQQPRTEMKKQVLSLCSSPAVSPQPHPACWQRLTMSNPEQLVNTEMWFLGSQSQHHRTGIFFKYLFLAVIKRSTRSMLPLNTNSLLSPPWAPGHHASTLCFYGFDYSRCLI